MASRTCSAPEDYDDDPRTHTVIHRRDRSSSREYRYHLPFLDEHFTSSFGREFLPSSFPSILRPSGSISISFNSGPTNQYICTPSTTPPCGACCCDSRDQTPCARCIRYIGCRNREPSARRSPPRRIHVRHGRRRDESIVRVTFDRDGEGGSDSGEDRGRDRGRNRGRNVRDRTPTPHPRGDFVESDRRGGGNGSRERGRERSVERVRERVVEREYVEPVQQPAPVVRERDVEHVHRDRRRRESTSRDRGRERSVERVVERVVEREYAEPAQEPAPVVRERRRERERENGSRGRDRSRRGERVRERVVEYEYIEPVPEPVPVPRERVVEHVQRNGCRRENTRRGRGRGRSVVTYYVTRYIPQTRSGSSSEGTQRIIETVRYVPRNTNRARSRSQHRSGSRARRMGVRYVNGDRDRERGRRESSRIRLNSDEEEVERVVRHRRTLSATGLRPGEGVRVRLRDRE
ncbi:hypothetical protein NHQ30_001396 [Ciborinia camelliae]|nr:hypothetical protein NHQ30_001396 [Ciborinia camelliae]